VGRGRNLRVGAVTSSEESPKVSIEDIGRVSGGLREEKSGRQSSGCNTEKEEGEVLIGIPIDSRDEKKSRNRSETSRKTDEIPELPENLRKY